MVFYRKIEERLYAYYNNQESKVLIINGARQIGKSFIIREIASKSFINYIEINLKEDYDGLAILPIEIKSGKNQYNYRALPKLIDKDGTYKLKKGFVFGNDRNMKQIDNLYIFPIYLIMFL